MRQLDETDIEAIGTALTTMQITRR
jgi:hypothetical protein